MAEGRRRAPPPTACPDCAALVAYANVSRHRRKHEGERRFAASWEHVQAAMRWIVEGLAGMRIASVQIVADGLQVRAALPALIVHCTCLHIVRGVVSQARSRRRR